jgi:diguanylate cyclase (GGDEF)-like protein
VFVFVSILLGHVRSAHRHQQALAASDPLTGVANPRSFMVVAQHTIDRCRRQGMPLTVAYVDIDNFKTINDALGHHRGDEVLRSIASSLAATTRESDLVARLGGDEFAVLLPGVGSEPAKSVMTDLFERVSDAITDIPMPVAFSAGAATFIAGPTTIEEMLSMTDELMYQAKRAGKNTFRHRTVGADEPGDRRRQAHAGGERRARSKATAGTRY